ncbi:DoxX family protein [Flavobacterium sedimenticola]|uniref:DoxX family protein n=1 Tax=Flavobacterium sedimenticola TaxID=3043286 RepID=A0ABT6XSI1_9FLAO|nr:DoxX family protein [Flavobacterium sedimenticola]MDI9257932.1 DoxX family protein [Flavobacterium sedimenticola]
MRLQFLKANDESIHFGLLLIRVLIGITFIIHGFPKLTGGVETWTFLGGTMKNIGIDFLPAFWGLLCAVAEFFGGILLILGIFTRVASIALFLTMIIATIFHISNNDPFDVSSHAIEDAIVFLGLFFTGAGVYSLDNKWLKK